ncbi:MAG: glycoside hydrolase domain-containing protein, partial [Acidobacteriota bacterium]
MGPGVKAPYSVTGDSDYVLFEPENGGIRSTQIGKVVTKREGRSKEGAVAHIAQSSAHTKLSAWVLASGEVCQTNGSSCLLATDDGGLHWIDVTPAQLRAAEPVLDGMPVPYAHQGLPSVTVTLQAKGFDTCSAPSISDLQAWWNAPNRPYTFVNMYFGGSDRGCKAWNQNMITASWVQQTLAMGWALLPTWVGPQAPNSWPSGQYNLISTNTTTARQQGRSEASSAASAAQSIGIGQGEILYVDIEGQYAQDSITREAVKAYVDGWVERLHALGYKAGAYGSAYNVGDWASVTNPPDAVWIVKVYFSNSCDTVFGLTPLPDNLWINHQRLRQCTQGHNETYSGVTLNVDTDLADGPLVGGGGSPPPPSSTTDGFDYPVGKPNATGYGITGWGFLQWTGSAYHPGEDWNGTGGGDTDLGDPVYATANGTVVAAGNYGSGWGNIILVRHDQPAGGNVWSQYAHLKDILVNSGAVVRGQQIGTIGKGYNNEYSAHLHFEIRKTNLAADAWVSGLSQAQVQDRYHNPSAFINANRPSTCNSPGAFALSTPSDGQSLASTTSVNLTWG